MPLWHFDQFYKRLAVTYQTQYILKMKILQIHFDTMFENLPKSRIQHCERSELRLHFECTKVDKNAKNGQFRRVFENLKLAVKQ